MIKLLFQLAGFAIEGSVKAEAASASAAGLRFQKSHPQEWDHLQRMYCDWQVVEITHRIKRNEFSRDKPSSGIDAVERRRQKKTYRELDLAKKRALAQVDRHIVEQEARCTALGLVLHSVRGVRLHATYALADKITDNGCVGWIPAADYS